VALATRPFLALYVAWHPDFEDGDRIARLLFNHYRRDVYKNVTGGIGLSVQYRSVPALGSTVPLPVDLDASETTAVVILADEHWVADGSYVEWGQAVREAAHGAGVRAQVFPVAIHRDAFALGTENAARWFEWAPEDRDLQLVTDLTYQFCRLLRAVLPQLQSPDAPEATLGQYLEKAQVFLSHTKHDPDGERIATLVREHLLSAQDFAAFFDVRNIPTGTRFDEVLLHHVRVSAVVAIHTDAYSSREWCRKEILEAKRHNVPLVVANCLSDRDERGFPYMGNVPVVRMDPTLADRIEHVVARLMDEVLRDFLWRCRTALAEREAGEDVMFLPRPPELVSLTSEAPREVDLSQPVTLVYPDPPLGAEEERLFELVAPNVRLRSFTEWTADTP
jgi:hypothetical protein